MASRSLGTLTLDVIAQVGGFVAGMDKAERSSTKWRKEVEKSAKAVGTAIGAGVAAAATAFTTMIVSAANSASEISNLAAVANVSVTDFQRMAVGAKTVGIEQDKLSDILKDVNDKVGDFLNTGGGGMADFFTQIAPKVGVTAEQFRNLSGSQALGLYVSSLEKAGVSQAEMTFYLEAIASDATALLPLLRNGAEGFKKYGDAAEAAGAVMDETTILAAKQFSSELSALGTYLGAVKTTLAAEFMPVLAQLSKDLASSTEEAGGLKTQISALADSMIETVAVTASIGDGIARAFNITAQTLVGSFDTAMYYLNSIGAASNEVLGKITFGETSRNFKTAAENMRQDALVNFGNARVAIEAINKELSEPLAGDKIRQYVIDAKKAAAELGGGTPPPGTFTPITPAQQAAAKAAETAAKKLQGQFDTAEEGYKRQIALINTETDKRKEATEVAKLAFELEQGKLKGLSEAQGNRLEGLAAELDAKKALLKADQDAKKLAALQVNLDEDNRTAKEGLDMELAGAGQGDKSRERFRALLAIEQDYNKQRREMYKEYKEALLAEDPDAEVNYQKETGALDKALKLRLEHQRNFYEQQDEMQGDWLAGVSDAWQNYVDIAADFSERAGAATESILGDATSSISDSLQGIIKGTESVGDAFGNLAATMANSVLGALTDIAAKWIVVQALKMAGITAETTATVAGEATKTTAKLATDAASTASSLTATATVASAQVAAAGTTMAAWLPAALVASVGSFGAAAIVGGTALLAAFALIKGFSGGGYTGAGGVNEPAGVVHKGEVVWSQADIKRFGGVSAVEALRKGKATPMGDLRSAGDSWDLPPQVASSSADGGGSANIQQVFNIGSDVSAQTVAMVQQGMRQTMTAILQDVNRNGQIMQTIRKKI
ncbi:phage tail tape measure C-terminal domain-containing protein [Pseudomonas putida]|uniref:phage tail tape measure C-terminal domain-containing protein n=1 Tax=Pseudomonas putida TaxID=303 RepID=UPI001E57DEA6|nr:phage tail tape measure C-terminal domain-containing protein [Pseudomonas putida]MCE0973584.1 tail tape measure protein [Pseudomonas putida]